MDRVMKQQASLFDFMEKEEALGLAGLLPQIRAAMNVAAARDLEGRKMLVEKINTVARREAVALTAGGGKSVSLEQVNKWLQPAEKGHAPSLDALVCFCVATGDASPLKPLLSMLRLVAVSREDLEYLEYGKACVALREVREKKKKLEAKL